MPEVIDTARDLTPGRLSVLKAAGVKTVIGYLTPNRAGEKLVTPTEAHNVAAAGMRLGLVFEVYGGSGNFTHNDINAITGTQHATTANSEATANGAPAGAVIWFAIDTDATAGQIASLVIPYFKSVRATLDPKYRVGVYGCGAVCAAVLDSGYASLAWLSNAMGWNGSRAFAASNRWALWQKLPATLAGIDLDPDVINPATTNIGDFVPFSQFDAPPVMEPDAASFSVAMNYANIVQLQTDLNRLPTTNPPLDTDGNFGTRTFTAVVLAVKAALANTSVAGG